MKLFYIFFIFILTVIKKAHTDHLPTVEFTFNTDSFNKNNVNSKLDTLNTNSNVVILLEDGTYGSDPTNPEYIVFNQTVHTHISKLIIRPVNEDTNFNLTAEVCSSEYGKFGDDYIALNNGNTPETLSSKVIMNNFIDIEATNATVTNLKIGTSIGAHDMKSLTIERCIFEHIDDYNMLFITGYFNDFTLEDNLIKDVTVNDYINTTFHQPNELSNIVIRGNFMEGVKGHLTLYNIKTQNSILINIYLYT